jgi:hypothetical protein
MVIQYATSIAAFAPVAAAPPQKGVPAQLGLVGAHVSLSWTPPITSRFYYSSIEACWQRTSNLSRPTGLQQAFMGTPMCVHLKAASSETC